MQTASISWVWGRHSGSGRGTASARPLLGSDGHVTRCDVWHLRVTFASPVRASRSRASCLWSRAELSPLPNAHAGVVTLQEDVGLDGGDSGGHWRGPDPVGLRPSQPRPQRTRACPQIPPHTDASPPGRGADPSSPCTPFTAGFTWPDSCTLCPQPCWAERGPPTTSELCPLPGRGCCGVQPPGHSSLDTVDTS